MNQGQLGILLCSSVATYHMKFPTKNLGYSLNNGNGEYYSDPQVLDTGTGFRALWSQGDPNNLTDKSAARIVISDEY